MALTSKEEKLAQSFKQRLQDLACPFTDGVDETWIVELLFRPGEPRIRLLQWLFTKFDTNLSEILDPQYVASDRKMDSRLQRILFIASTLGLCDAENVDLIRGTVSVSKQTAFMDQLIDLVHIRDSAEDPKSKFQQSPGMVGASTDLNVQFQTDCEFIEAIASNEKMDDLFMNHVKLLPPDLSKRVELGLLDRGYKDISRAPLPDAGKLIEAAKEFTADLQKQIEILEELNKLGDFPENDSQVQDRVNRTLKLVLSELSQLLVGFSYCFENEVRPWCNKAAPKLVELGPVVKRVHTLLQQFCQLTHSLDAIHHNHKLICTEMRTELTKLNERMTPFNSDPSSRNVAKYFQQCTDVLEDSLARQDNVNSTMNSTGMSASLKFR